MSVFIPGTPQPGEYNPAFAGYIAKAISFPDPVEQLERQAGEFLGALRTFDPAKRMYRYAPQKWSVQELLGHVTDAERIFAYRALRIARADDTPLAGFDENTYVVAARAEECDWDELLEEFEHVRRASRLLFRHFPEAAWTREAIVNGAALSVRAVAYIMIGHVAHHLDVLGERYLVNHG
jgi:hypothetical protein